MRDQRGLLGSAPFGVLFVFHFVADLTFSQSPFHENHRCAQQQLGRNEKGDSKVPAKQ